MSKTYADRCGIARALDLVGERWTLLIVRELVLGPKRYTDLDAALPGVSTDVLAQRLRTLETAGIVERSTLPPPAASRVYSLTDRGHELEPVLHALGRFGSTQPMPEGEAAFGSDAAVMALPTLFDSTRAGHRPATVELRVGDDVFTARVESGRLDVTRGAASEPGVVLAASPPRLAAALWHGAPLADIVATGDKRLAAWFARLFPLPG